MTTITKLPYGNFELHGYIVMLSLDDVHGALWNIYKLGAIGKAEEDRAHVASNRDRAIKWIEHAYELSIGQYES
jgi:hypothetical protein